MSSPTAKQRRAWTRLAAVGCIACYKDGDEGTPGQIHHIKQPGYHNHDFVLCLCDNHHNTPNKYVPCVHHNQLQFNRWYGSEYDLLALSLELIGEAK